MNSSSISWKHDRTRALLLGTVFAAAIACSDHPSEPAIDAGPLDILADSASDLSTDRLTDSPAQDAESDADVAEQYPAAPVIDGILTEWQDTDLLSTDPMGDAGAAFDVTKVYARSRGTVLYLSFDIGSELNLQSGAEEDGGLRLEIGLPESRLTVDFRGQTIYRDGDPNRWIAWRRLEFTVAPTYASTAFELQIDLAELGADSGDPVSVHFEGSDRTDSATLTLSAPADPTPPLRSAGRGEGAAVRIANLNTQESGLSDPERAGAIGRLLGAVDADIYCFQEERETQNSAIAFALQSITNKSGWTIHRVRSSIIATRGIMEPVETESRRFAAARVRIEDAPELLVISYHGSCCGHAGSQEDSWRLSEAQAIVRLINANPEVPAVVIGDWNLVGARAPLTTVEAAGLTRWHLESLRPGHFWTWYSSRSRYTPGQLDILVHDPDRLDRVHGYILSTHTMNADEAATLGLMGDDSDASDHQVLVADFR
jgi:endonuclease/exonuclease/phosphatase family metal-dependent hydrolase